MTQKTSLTATLFGSAVISAAVSIGYNHFFVPKKDLLERELNFVSTLNTVLKEQKDRDELGRLTFVTNVLHPLYADDPEFSVVIEYFMKAKSKTTAETSGQIGNALDAALTRGAEPIASTAALDSLAKNKRIPSNYTVESIRTGFFSGYRRQLSDKLVSEIDQGEAGLPEILISAIIQNDAKHEYRVNLYIAFTLARTTEWTASETSYKPEFWISGFVIERPSC